ncbi:MAG TPA: hypothetical protein VJ436_00945, partial [Anaerolineales bacterium]|nr:hypothetical protein [Anaerolineales bacterium]
MNRKLSRVLNVFVGLAMLAILFLGSVGESRAELAAAPKNAQSGPSTEDVVSTRMNAPKWTAAKEPWTKAQMLAAKPYPMPALAGEAQKSITAEELAGAPGNFP